MSVTAKRNIITDKLVVEKTGATIEHWFTQLDKAGAKKLSHKEIFGLIQSITCLQPLGEWNHNLLATTYEWEKGLKERGQKENGFEISVSKTVETPIEFLYNAWTDDVLRRRWLKEKIVFRKTTLNKSVRLTWSDVTTNVSVDFYSKGESKSQVVVQHLKLPDAKKAEEMKVFWTEKLAVLKLLLEK